jgi:manganese oxidase
MSDKNSENLNKTTSRRKFLKAGALAGGAAVVGLSLGIPALTSASTVTPQTATPNTSFLDINQNNNDGNDHSSSNYKPVTRKYYLYSTDGIAWLPTTPLGDERRPIYVYGFAKPLSDTRPFGSTTSPTNPFADLNWIDKNTGQSVMRGKAQLASPPIWGVEGDILEITLFNLGFAFRRDIMDPHTVHLHGVHAPNYYDGIPELSFGVPMWDGTLPATQDTIKTHSFTYRMYCERPGTYMYHCHVEASEHVQMGMYGPMWIYPKQYGKTSQGGAAYNNSLTQFSQEAIILMSEMDTRWHDSLLDVSALTVEPNPKNAVLDGSQLGPGQFAPGVNGTNQELINFNPVDYRPNFWLVNGRAFPDTAFPGKYKVGYQPGTALTNGTDTLTYYPPTTLTGPSAPTGTVLVPRQPVQTYLRTEVAEKVLVRMSNMGFQYQPEHFHGVMPLIVGKDTFSWVPQANSMFSTTTDERKRVFTQGIFSGETYDMIIAYPDKAAISPSVYGAVLNNPVAMPYSTWEPVWGTVLPAIAGAPAVPVAQVPTSDGSAPPGTLEQGLKSGYPLFYLWHSHDDYRVTNNGVYPGGAVVLVRVDKNGISPTPSIPANNIAP